MLRALNRLPFVPFHQPGGHVIRLVGAGEDHRTPRQPHPTHPPSWYDGHICVPIAASDGLGTIFFLEMKTPGRQGQALKHKGYIDIHVHDHGTYGHIYMDTKTSTDYRGKSNNVVFPD